MLRFAAPAAAIAAVVLAPSAGAIVPPKDCGRTTLAGKRYQVKVDQISCSTGRTYVKNLALHHRKPRGYSCQTFKAQKNRVRWSCNNGRKVFFAIRR